MAVTHSRRDDNLLEEIQARLDSLNKSERKVAEAILRDPSAATRYSIAALARTADVSEPTVNRFCRGFSASGFPDFKIRLAQSIATGTPYIGQNIEPDDSVAEFADKIMLTTMATIDKARQGLSPKDLATAIDFLIQAKQINFFGMGGSAPVALDAQHKFFRFNIPVMCYDDALMQRMVSAGSSTGDVIVIISYTGRTKESIEIAQDARANGATVIAITTPGSPLAEVCTVVLGVSADEDTEVYMPMASRIVHLTIIDILATGVTLKRGEDFRDHLKKIKDSLKPTRLPPQAS
ncbi:transcriptional regulator HexR [Marinobacter zhejiangensis]|uniref:Transcriptional regulator, RpiR family n=1 Tax=Marinobacter zhejiangensis TaxID=488535 RepID=A0A1I4NXS7_9GAMM|nr:transcriptional regulator HexR [Marinobacter zhejiangensis]SFM20332.1 transcriptional regulator, RpiR family [Marinobacter zhejiangensis]